MTVSTSVHPLLALCQSFINFICVPYLLQLSIGCVMHYMFHQLSDIYSVWQGHGVLTYTSFTHLH